MRALTVVIVVLLTCLLGVMAFATFRQQKWEYVIIAPSDEKLESELDKLGDMGWEIVSTRRATSGSGQEVNASYEMILKRRKGN